MQRLLLLLILVLASSVFAQSARLIKHGAPVVTTVEGYDKGHCIGLPKNIRICKLLSDDKDTFLVQKDGKSIGTWPGNAELGETSDFEVLTGDLDNDDRPELIVANHDGTSNGLGIDYWTIFIFPDSEFHRFNAPLTFSVEEYGSFGTFVTSGGRINILTTTWVGNEDPKHRRGWGMYLVGQWWRYQSGELRPLLERSIIARRYLFGFENERNAPVKTGRIPFKWLSHPSTDSVRTDFITGQSNTRKPGVIQSVRKEKESIRIVFQPDGKESVTYVYPGTYQDKNQLEYFGDTATSRLYPKNYQPSQWEQWLKNKRATLRHYEDKELDVLWMERRQKQ
jgi:hypothetical protein